MKIALISCTKLKKDYRCEAQEMYSPSSLFSKALRYVKSKDYDEIFILSAKYGLISLERIIDPYDETLNTYKTSDLKLWSVAQTPCIIAQYPKQVDFYTGEKYRKFIIPILELSGIKCAVPLKGLGIGQQMQFYNKEMN